MLCALLSPISTTAAELFKAWKDYTARKRKWSFCVTICGNGAAVMTGQLSGFTTRVRKAASECESVHCVIHREMLASRKTAPELDDVLQDVTEMINHMEVRALRSHLFSRLREGMDAERTRLLSRTEVRWLLNRSLARVPEL